jgi:hypothetical protein
MRLRGQEADIQGVPLCGAFPLSAIQQKGYTTEKCKAPRTLVETELVGTYSSVDCPLHSSPGGLRTLGHFFSTRMGQSTQPLFIMLVLHGYHQFSYAVLSVCKRASVGTSVVQ